MQRVSGSHSLTELDDLDLLDGQQHHGVSHFLNHSSSGPLSLAGINGVGRHPAEVMALDLGTAAAAATRFELSSPGSLAAHNSSQASGYPALVSEPWGDYIPSGHYTSTLLQPPPRGMAASGARFLQPRSAITPASHGFDHTHTRVYPQLDSYPDRTLTFHNSHPRTGCGFGYDYGAGPSGLSESSLTTSSVPLVPPIPMPISMHIPGADQFGGYPHLHSGVGEMPMEMQQHLGDQPGQAQDEMFYTSSGLYGLGSSMDTVRPSLTLTLPGLPSAEEAFLSHLNVPESAGAINPSLVHVQPIAGGESQDPQRELYLAGSDLEINLYNTHIGTGSPSSSDSSSRTSQKRVREDNADLGTSSSVVETRMQAASRPKRQRLEAPRTGRKKSNVFASSEDGGDDDGFADSGNDGDSDDYIPSRSVSPVLLPSLYLTSPSPPRSTVDESSSTPTGEAAPVKGRRGRKKGKGKAKGSAARALAIVMKVREQQDLREQTAELGAIGGGLDLTVSPTPVPGPFMTLTKKSRGRKVPYVPAVRGGTGVGEGVPVSGAMGPSPSGRRGRRRAGPTTGRMSSAEADQEASHGEERTFVCVVPGCGKCFVRGEHLKRHVRSIHTDDKPHMCPFKGCGKTFSRKDNLGQHVRIHLDE